MRIGRIVTTSAVVLAMLAALLAYARFQSLRPVSLAPSGEFTVGRVSDLWVDRSRTDQFAPLGGTPRTLSAFVWYPAAPGATGPEAVYAPGEWAGLHRFGWAATDFDRVRTGTPDAVPPADGPFPVVVLLPDRGSSAPQYTAVASGLAARGYLVVGITPTYSAGLTVINDQRVAASAAGSAAHRDDQLIAVWAADARFAAQRAALQFGGHANPARIAYAGHGLGGSAAIEACRLDGRCAAAVSLNGPPRGLAATDGLSRPLLQLYSPTAPAAAPAGPSPAHSPAPASSPRRGSAPGSPDAYVLAGAEHLNFTDYAAYRIVAPARWALPLGSLDGRRGLTIATDYTASFLNAALAGTPWIAPPYPEVRRADIMNG